MTPPRAVLDAISAISLTVPCLEDCGEFVAVHWSELRQAVVVVHPDQFCTCLRDGAGPEALALADFVLERLAEHVLVGDYGEPLPVHCFTGASRW